MGWGEQYTVWEMRAITTFPPLAAVSQSSSLCEKLQCKNVCMAQHKNKMSIKVESGN